MIVLAAFWSAVIAAVTAVVVAVVAVVIFIILFRPFLCNPTLHFGFHRIARVDFIWELQRPSNNNSTKHLTSQVQKH